MYCTVPFVVCKHCGVGCFVERLFCFALVQVVSPGDVLAVVGKGMPMKGNPFVKGDLCIKFDVKFPKAGELSVAQLAVCASL